MIHPTVLEMSEEIKPYLRPLGYVPPPVELIRSWQERWPRETTTTAQYCLAATASPYNRAVGTLCTVLDVARSGLC